MEKMKNNPTTVTISDELNVWLVENNFTCSDIIRAIYTAYNSQNKLDKLSELVNEHTIKSPAKLIKYQEKIIKEQEKIINTLREQN
jgi:hypothetical protein